MVSVVSLLLVLALSMLVIRVGSVAFLMTGLSEEVARFQALSAFSGTGFTTDEAESIVKNPARRRIATQLIRLGSIGVVSAISTLLLSFVGSGQTAPERLLVLLLGVCVLIGLARSRAFNRVLTPLIERSLARYTTLDLRDYADLLHLREDYRIVEVEVEDGTWLANHAIGELNLAAEGVLVLGVKRSREDYIGTPPADLQLRPRDLLVLYGRKHRLHELSDRASGDQFAHHEAKAEHERNLDEQQTQIERMNAASKRPRRAR
ncbi:TrkA-C domain protein [filamentous cyanobacterium CCP1]|nr:TrkA-C domain protein [filamentous cyanobacterium CCP2]PSB66884.1 TrkA-C domain protein [filamentous cyanobacterium CCP1]